MQARDVPYSHQGLRLNGYLVSNERSSAKRPGVLVVHDAFGFSSHVVKRAERLAERGYVALAVDMFGDRSQLQFTEVQAARGRVAALCRDYSSLRGRIHAGLEVLRADPLVDQSKIAAIGYCFGGKAVLELARSGADVAGVVSFHGSLDAVGPIEGKIRSRILCCHGADDPIVPDSQVAEFIAEMKASRADWQLNIYGRAMHGFGNEFLVGAEARGAMYDEATDKKSWAAMHDFLDWTFAAR